MTEQPVQTDLFAVAFFTADHAATESGKIYISGGAWNRTAHPAYPVGLTFGVCSVLSIPWRAHNQVHSFSIWFEDADGNDLGAKIAGTFQAVPAPDARAGDSSIAPVTVNINGLILQRPGDYFAVLSVDGTEIARWHFRAVQAVQVPGLQLSGGDLPQRGGSSE
jgi:hypothetical protein